MSALSRMGRCAPLRLAALVFHLTAAGQTVRVLSYNIHHGENAAGTIDLATIAQVIRQADPDLAALQEVDVRTERVSGVDQVQELARLTGMHAVFGRTMDYRGGWYGNALLSRWPVQSFLNHQLPFTPGREPRGLIEAQIRPWPGAERHPGFRFFATHLDTSEQDRLRAVAWLGEYLQKLRDSGPMLLAGDLNATPDSRTLQGLLATWSSADLGEPLWTFPANRPARQIDFILLRPKRQWKVRQVRVPGEPAASDHRPILAVLEWAP